MRILLFFFFFRLFITKETHLPLQGNRNIYHTLMFQIRSDKDEDDLLFSGMDHDMMGGPGAGVQSLLGGRRRNQQRLCTYRRSSSSDDGALSLQSPPPSHAKMDSTAKGKLTGREEPPSGGHGLGATGADVELGGVGLPRMVGSGNGVSVGGGAVQPSKSSPKTMASSDQISVLAGNREEQPIIPSGRFSLKQNKLSQQRHMQSSLFSHPMRDASMKNTPSGEGCEWLSSRSEFSMSEEEGGDLVHQNAMLPLPQPPRETGNLRKWGHVDDDDLEEEDLVLDATPNRRTISRERTNPVGRPSNTLEELIDDDEDVEDNDDIELEELRAQSSGPVMGKKVASPPPQLPCCIINPRAAIASDEQDDVGRKNAMVENTFGEPRKFNAPSASTRGNPATSARSHLMFEEDDEDDQLPIEESDVREDVQPFASALPNPQSQGCDDRSKNSEKAEDVVLSTGMARTVGRRIEPSAWASPHALPDSARSTSTMQTARNNLVEGKKNMSSDWCEEEFFD